MNPNKEQKPATKHTRELNQGFRDALNLNNQESFQDAQRGFITTLSPMAISREDGSKTYTLEDLEFLEGDCPDSVNPSLWRQAQLNANYTGLFEVCPGIYQVRSFDIANITFVMGETGWIVVDALTSAESSRAALQLVNEQLGERPVKGIIITHSHADHFAGILGIFNAEEPATKELPIIAPLDFTKEALSENVLAGNVMNRRATYMYGNLLKSSPTGFVTTGLGARLSMGSTGFLEPTDTITETGEKRIIDGIEFEFQMAMDTEAPSEMMFYLPKFKALCTAEVTSHNLHNLYTPRGALVRDALNWSGKIDEAIRLFSDRTDVQFGCHHWPIWGKERVISFLKKQRDLYKFIHDQTLRLANKGFSKEEIAEQIKLPKSLSQEFFNRDYYGTVHHNSKAVFVRYLGYFDGNPSTLYERPPVERAIRYVEWMGGPAKILEKARESFDSGDYRWTAEVLNHVVMADENHEEAKCLLADTLEQLGYQSESATWRNFFLCGALELREGLPPTRDFVPSSGMAAGIPIDQVFKTMAVRLLPDQVDGEVIQVGIDLTDDAPYLLSIENCVLNYWREVSLSDASAILRISSNDFKALMLGILDAMTLINEGRLEIKGDANILMRFGTLFDQFPRRFPIVTPRES